MPPDHRAPVCELLNNEILPQLSHNGIHLLRRSKTATRPSAWVKQYFDKEVRPLLTPIGLDPAHPFPRVINKSLNFIVELAGKDAFGRGTGIAIMKAPRVLPRVIRLPDELSDKPGVSYCLLSSVIQAHMADLFTGREWCPIRSSASPATATCGSTKKRSRTCARPAERTAQP
jgi:polyphosphate kinase